jgi:iron complex transport system ATP-binding protein
VSAARAAPGAPAAVAAGRPAADDPTIRAEGLSCGYGKTRVVDSASFSVRQGEVLCLLGPNGVGKSTLFKTMLGLLPAQGGRLVYQGEDTAGWSRRRFAQVIGYVPQSHAPSFPFTVRDVVLMGRTPQLGVLSTVGQRDTEIAYRVMEDLGIISLAERDYTTLSGGERQLVLICRALAQESKVLVMDEPTANLDFGNRVRVLERVRSLAGRGLSVIMTTHDPNQAFQIDGTVALMGHGGRFELGLAREVITEANLQAFFGVRTGLTELVSPEGERVMACVPFLGPAPGRGY